MIGERFPHAAREGAFGGAGQSLESGLSAEFVDSILGSGARGRRRHALQVKCAEQPAASGWEPIPFGDLQARLLEVGAPRVHFDLSFDFQVDEGGVGCSFTYANAGF